MVPRIAGAKLQHICQTAKFLADFLSFHFFFSCFWPFLPSIATRTEEAPCSAKIGDSILFPFNLASESNSSKSCLKRWKIVSNGLLSLIHHPFWHYFPPKITNKGIILQPERIKTKNSTIV